MRLTQNSITAELYRLDFSAMAIVSHRVSQWVTLGISDCGTIQPGYPCFDEIDMGLRAMLLQKVQ
jgi:hypothetical protein